MRPSAHSLDSMEHVSLIKEHNPDQWVWATSLGKEQTAGLAQPDSARPPGEAVTEDANVRDIPAGHLTDESLSR